MSAGAGGIQGPWGPYPGPGRESYTPYGWAIVNPDGTVVLKSRTLTIVRDVIGVYRAIPLDSIPLNLLLPTAICNDGTNSQVGVLSVAGAPNFVRISTYSGSPAIPTDRGFTLWLSLGSSF